MSARWIALGGASNARLGMTVRLDDASGQEFTLWSQAPGIGRWWLLNPATGKSYPEPVKAARLFREARPRKPASKSKQTPLI